MGRRSALWLAKGIWTTIMTSIDMPERSAPHTIFHVQMPGYQGKLQFASGEASDSVFGTHDPMRTAHRLQEREEKIQACS